MIGNVSTGSLCICLLLVAVAFAQEGSAPKAALPGGPGLAARYPGDKGIEKDRAVVFAENFEAGGVESLKGRWSSVGNKAGALSLSEEIAPGSAGLHSLAVTAKRGENEGGYLYKILKPGYDELYARLYVKFAPDYGFDHHFCSLGGEIDPKPWPVGKAGLRPKRRFGTGLEPTTALLHTWPPKRSPPPGFWHFYTYWPEMHSWETVEGVVKNNPPEGTGTSFYGNNFSPAEPTLALRDKWICLEWMVKLNSDPEKSDGAQRFWIDGKLVGDWGPRSVEGYWVRENFRIVPGDKRQGPFEGFRWRTDMRVQINKFKVENYVSEGSFKASEKYAGEHPDFPINTQQYTCWFDNIVLATEYIGPLQPAKPDEGSASR